MRKQLSLALTIGMSMMGTAQTGSTCSNPDTITALPFTIVGQTTQGYGNDYGFDDACNSPRLEGEEYVFFYMPSVDECVTVTSTHVRPETSLFVFDGCPDQPSTRCIAMAEYDPSISNPTTCTVQTRLLAGLGYFIMVAPGEPDTFTVFNLTVTSTAPPTVGLTCASAVVIGSIPYTYTGTTQCAGNDYGYGDACSGAYLAGEDFVFAFTPSATDCYAFAVANTDIHTGLFVTEGCPDAASARCIARRESSTGSPALSVLLYSGVQYYVIVSSVGKFTPFTAFTLTVASTPEPTPGATCADPIVIPPLGMVPYVQVGMSTQCYGNDYDHDDACLSTYLDGEEIVYEYTVGSSDECVDIALSNTRPYTALFLFDGCPDNPGTTCLAKSEMPFGNPSISITLQAGQSYYFIISNYPEPLSESSTMFDMTVTRATAGLLTQTFTFENDCPFEAYDVPVQIDLNAVNTDFSQCSSAGDDLRFFRIPTPDPFTETNGKLDYWIESFDKINETGTVWVSLDTMVPGNNTIYFYYGIVCAAAESNGEETFILFDDFNDNSFNTGKWVITENTPCGGIPCGQVKELNQRLELWQREISRTLTVESVQTFPIDNGSNGEGCAVLEYRLWTRLDDPSFCRVPAPMGYLVDNPNNHWARTDYQAWTGVVWLRRDGYNQSLGQTAKTWTWIVSEVELGLNGWAFWADWNEVSKETGALLHFTDTIYSTHFGLTDQVKARLSLFQGGSTQNCLQGVAYDNVRIRKCVPCEPTLLDARDLKLDGFVSDEKIILQWNDKLGDIVEYDIERATGPEGFQSIGEAASGEYDFVDDNPAGSLNYYRLKGLTADGGTKYSNIVAIYLEKPLFVGEPYPNPAREFVIIPVQSDYAQQVTVVLRDIMGRIVSETRVDIGLNGEEIRLSVSELLAGPYQLELRTDSGFVESHTFLVD